MAAAALEAPLFHGCAGVGFVEQPMRNMGFLDSLSKPVKKAEGARASVPLLIIPDGGLANYALAVAAKAFGGSGLAWFCDCCWFCLPSLRT